MVQFLEVWLLVVRMQIESDVAEGVRVDLVVLGEAVGSGVGQVDKKVVAEGDAVLEGRRGYTLALQVFSTAEAGVDVVV